MEQTTQTLPNFQLAQPLDRKLPAQPTPPTPETIQPEPAQPVQQPAQTPPLPNPGNNQPGYIEESEFFNQFSGKKQTTQTGGDLESPEPGGAAAQPQPEIFVPNPNAINIPREEKPLMDESTAAKETAKWMKFRENLQAFGIALYADGKFDTADQYRYTPQQFNQLVTAYSPIVQRANVKLPPLADIALAEIMCTGPLLGLMQQNRKHRQQIKDLKKQNADLRKEVTKVTQMRKDSQRYWEIGYNDKGVYGFFTYNIAGKYLKIADRTVRPELTKENIALLVKYNGQEAVDKLMNS